MNLKLGMAQRGATGGQQALSSSLELISFKYFGGDMLFPITRASLSCEALVQQTLL